MPSRGLGWAVTMLCLDAAEVAVLSNMIFVDHPESGFTVPQALWLYFWVVAGSCVLQGAGILLVLGRWFKVGGACQIVSSAVHLLKIEGLIVVIGGLKAWRHPEALERWKRERKGSGEPRGDAAPDLRGAP